MYDRHFVGQFLWARTADYFAGLKLDQAHVVGSVDAAVLLVLLLALL